MGRLLFALRRRFRSHGALTEDFNQERRRIAELVASCHTEAARRRVLIPRVRGLEDSSRYWSVWMTLDHLRIVHGAFTRIIAALVQDRDPGGVASTAAVKPGADVGPDVVGAYERSCDDLLATISRSGGLRTTRRYAHPWFGPLDAAGWHALAGTHLRIHRVQIERILTAVGARGP